MTTRKSHSGRIALVTGASRGIGAAAAKELARQGAHVILAARSQGGLEEVDDAIRAEGGSATLVPLDLREPQSCIELAKAIESRWGRLDALVAAAGVLGPLTPVSQIEPKLWAETFTVNFHANWALIRALEPLLKASDSGRAVFLTSGAVKSTRAYWSAYAASKAALDALVECWAKEMAATNVRANLVNPGPMRTAMRKAAFPGEDPQTLPPPEALAPLIADMAGPDYAENGAWVDFPTAETALSGPG